MEIFIPSIFLKRLTSRVKRIYGYIEITEYKIDTYDITVKLVCCHIIIKMLILLKDLLKLKVTYGEQDH
jgi:hypothetical protein